MKKYWMRIAALGAAAWLLLSGWGFAQAPYVPEKPVRIKTESLVNEVPGRPNTFSMITVRSMDISEGLSENALQIGFFAADSGKLIGTLNFAPFETVSWVGPGQTTRYFQTDNLLIIPGISVPVDVLPIFRILNVKGPVNHEFSRTAGGRTFTDLIRLSMHPVNLKEAHANNWLVRDDATAGELIMFEATDIHTGALIVRQLWTADDSWWLYEETPFRRSRRTR